MHFFPNLVLFWNSTFHNENWFWYVEWQKKAQEWILALQTCILWLLGEIKQEVIKTVSLTFLSEKWAVYGDNGGRLNTQNSD